MVETNLTYIFMVQDKTALSETSDKKKIEKKTY